MLQIPVEVTTLPTQPVFPSKTIASIDGIRAWWTSHVEDMRLNTDGRQTIRPVVGTVPLLQAGDAFSFPEVTINKKKRRPALNDKNGNKFWTAPLALEAGWNSYVCAVQLEDFLESYEAAVVKVATGAILIYPFRGASATNGACVSWLAGTAGTETRIIETGALGANVPVYVTIAHNTATGAVKAAFNGGTVLSAATSPAALTSDLTCSIEFGRRNASNPFNGRLLNFGHVVGDVLATEASRVKLRSYMNALYGIPA
ncbi:hypothetical protein H4P12_08515 [Paracoccus sp. 11-3]|uniref:Uncharacterized protein n=1 Tax=Paracoccus amoyensis TaxID=2760093 RepID=A0A926GG66_9RHOB|nr:hypothetical protein [Paracoccus amoyensis]MBC9246754.1 hypothetical protein [Paracoccus amoyensis]